MNVAQRIVLGIGALAVLLIVLFPPWLFVYDYPGADNTFRGFGTKKPPYYTTRFGGYHSITETNTPTDQSYLAEVFGLDNADLRYFSMRIDKDRLWLQLAGAVLVTLFLCFLVKPKRRAEA